MMVLMDKSRANHYFGHDKDRFNSLVAIFSVFASLGFNDYKVYAKQSFEQKIESLKKNEMNDQLTGNQKDRRKGRAK